MTRPDRPRRGGRDSAETAMMSPSNALASALDSHARALDYCTYCPKLCRHSCPVGGATGRETHSPQAKMQLLGALRRNHLPWQSDFVEPLFACTGCRRCSTYCDHDNAVADAMLDGRAVAAARGVTHPALATLEADWTAEAAAQSKALHAAFGEHEIATSGAVGYLPHALAVQGDCAAVRHARDVLVTIGHDAKLIDATCFDGAYALWAAGLADRARHAGEELVRRIRGFALVVCEDPRTVEILRSWLPREGVDHTVRVLHISEVLADIADVLPVKRRRARVFYHDACDLGRGLEYYEAPRRVLQACADEVSELFHSRERADCCGAGGLVDVTFPEVVERASRPICDEVALYGGDLLVSASPRCSCALAAAAPSGVEVMSLIELVRWAMTPD